MACKDPEQRRAYNRAYYKRTWKGEVQSKCLENHKRLYRFRKRKGLCITGCGRKALVGFIYCSQHREKDRAKQIAQYHANPKPAIRRARQRRLALRNEVIKAYGGKCTCCGIAVPEFLAIDHKYNDGAKHRAQIGEGNVLYGWLKRHNFPKKRFQLHCHNCNAAKSIYGKCPHKRTK